MESDGAPAVLALLSAALRLPVSRIWDAPTGIQSAVWALADVGVGDVRPFTVDDQRYLACRYHQQRGAVIIVGPGSAGADADINRDDSIALIHLAVQALQHAVEAEQRRIELSAQLEVTGRSVLAVTSELSLNVVLHRIVDLARELSGARYGALGVPDTSGGLEAFLTSGMTPEQEARIGHRPVGLGILGLLLREPKAIRLRDLADHPASVGFPANHPPMTSFLGVPIVSRGQVLGNLYLTEKRTDTEFTEHDVRQVEILARHAGVAIENARLYQKLESQERRLQLLVDQLPEAVLLAENDPDRITLANKQASFLLGWNVEIPMPLTTFLARNIRRGPDGRILDDEDVPMVRVMHRGEVVNRQELQIEQPGGRLITVLINSAPLLNDDRDVLGSMTTFQDITQIKDAEQLKDDFLSLVSHELRTPLTTIRGGALMLQRDWTRIDPETQQAFLADIASESHRLGGLIENMVQLANIRAGRAHLETEPVIVGLLIEEAVEGIRDLAPDWRFQTEVEPQLLAEIDYARIDQVLRNLLQNAVKYSPIGSTIEIAARRADDMVEVAVRDHGSGIAEDELLRVFDRFHRSEHWKTSSTPGMGLGLYLARHVVEAHSGAIWAEQPTDGGTRMAFTIPLIHDE